MKIDTLFGSSTRRVYSSGKIILPKFHFEYFKDKTLNPIYSKFKDYNYNIIQIADSRDLEKKFQDGYALITESRRLVLPKEAIDYINKPEKVMLLGMFDRLEVWDSKDFEEYNKFYPGSLEELAKNLTPEELENFHF